jgi:hypothetical protein
MNEEKIKNQIDFLFHLNLHYSISSKYDYYKPALRRIMFERNRNCCDSFRFTEAEIYILKCHFLENNKQPQHIMKGLACLFNRPNRKVQKWFSIERFKNKSLINK